MKFNFERVIRSWGNDVINKNKTYVGVVGDVKKGIGVECKFVEDLYWSIVLSGQHCPIIT